MKRPARPRAALAALRRRIDRLDASMLRLLARRVELGRRAGEAKRRLGRAHYDPARERSLRERLGRMAPAGVPLDALADLYREIVSLTRAQEGLTSVAYLGPEGGLGHWAAVQRFGRASRHRPCLGIDELLRTVEGGEAGFGVFSLEGQPDLPPLDTFDLLLDARARLCGEFRGRDALAVLASGRGAPRAIAAPVGLLVEHERWLRAHFPGAALEPAASLAEAARRAAGRRGLACLGSPLQARGLRAVRRLGGEGTRHGRRYLVLARDRVARTGHDKTLLLAALPHRPGALARALAPLARRRINLLGISARASRGRPWQHVFLLELAGHEADRRVASALAEIRGLADYLKVLGSFPAEV